MKYHKSVYDLVCFADAGRQARIEPCLGVNKGHPLGKSLVQAGAHPAGGCVGMPLG